MSLSKLEAAIVEATGNFLKENPKLGLSIHPELKPEHEHGSQFKWSNIGEYFRTLLNGSKCVHVDPICAAFTQAHSYMFIDNPRFELSFRQNMNSAPYAVPTTEQDIAIEELRKIVKDLSSEDPGEKDAGWNPDMAGIVDITTNADDRTPKPSKPFSGGGPCPKGGDYSVGNAIANETELDPTRMK